MCDLDPGVEGSAPSSMSMSCADEDLGPALRSLLAVGGEGDRLPGDSPHDLARALHLRAVLLWC
jgi:hypothetical protein